MIRDHPGFPSAVIFAAASVWGLYWVPLRALEDAGLTGGWAVALFNALPVAVLGPWMAWQGGPGRRGWRTAVVVGLLTGGGMGLYAMGLVHSSVVRATLLFYLTPVWSTLIGAAWLGEEIGWRRMAAIAAGFAGLALLLSGGQGGSAPLNVGDLFALLSGIAWAFGAAAIRRFTQVPVVAMTLFQFLFAALTAGLVAYLLLAPPVVAQPGVALGIGAAGAIGFIMPSVLAIFWASKRVFPGRVGLLMMSEVIVAIASASLLLPEERMGAVEWAGAVLIVGACLLEVRRTRARERPA